MIFGNWLSGAATWVGKDVMIRTVPVTLAKAKVDIAKARQFIRTQNLEKLAVHRFKESRKEKEAQPVESPIVPETPDVPRWKKTINWANHYAAMKYGEPAIGAHELEGCLSPAERVQARGHHIKGTHQVQEADMVSTDRFSDDLPPDDSSDELDSDDIVAYDTETSRYTTLAKEPGGKKGISDGPTKEIEGLSSRDTSPHSPYHCSGIARKKMPSLMWIGAGRYKLW